MIVLQKNYTKLLYPIYYLFHKNIFFGLLHKVFIKNFYYKNLKFELKVKNLPLSVRSSFLFKTYEINDRLLVERHINKNNKCIVIGGGIGFIPSLIGQLSKNPMLIFEVNQDLKKNLIKNLKNNNCKYNLFFKNLNFQKKKKKFFYSKNKNFLASSKYLKSKEICNIDNIYYKSIRKIFKFNTLIIDAEGCEFDIIINLKKMKFIKHIIFELHFNLLSKVQIEKIFFIMKKNNFQLVDKFFNSFYFKKI